MNQQTLQPLQKSPFFISLSWLVLLLITITLIRFGIIASHSWPINGDEAQYWSWGKHLAFGYYSKPPMVAWLIALTTHFFGNGILGLRFASPVCHAITATTIFFIGRRLFNQQIGFWSALTFILLPGVSFSADIISTDVPLLMFWALSFYCLIRALEKNQLRWWSLLGVALGFAMLSKYAAIAFPLSALLYFLITPERRWVLKSYGFYFSLIVMAVILIPNFIWNYQHGFVSFIAVKNNADLHGNFIHPLHMLNFIGAQFAIFGPILFIGLLMMFWRWREMFSDARLKMLLLFVIPLLTVMTIEGLLVRAHGNWAAPIYVTATIAVTAVIIQDKKIYWLIAALILHAVMVLGLYNFQSIVRTVGIHLPTKTTTLHWQTTGKEIAAIRKQYGNIPFISDDRMLLTKTMYFADIPLKQAYAWNPLHRIHSQYDMESHLGKEKNKSFLLVTYQANPVGIFSRFSHINRIKTIHMATFDGRGQNLYLFYLQGFMGYASR